MYCNNYRLIGRGCIRLTTHHHQAPGPTSHNYFLLFYCHFRQDTIRNTCQYSLRLLDFVQVDRVRSRTRYLPMYCVSALLTR